MEHPENIAGLGKNHDQEAHDHDIAKKQSEAKPAAENLDMMPNSKNADGSSHFLPADENEHPEIKNINEKADAYAKEEHDKAENWEHKRKD